MQKTLLVMRHEILTAILRPSFLFTAFGIPLISALVVFGMAYLNRSAPNAAEAFFGTSGPVQQKPFGYVDRSGLIEVIPASAPAGVLVAFPDEAAAHQALQAGEIAGYFQISRDYLKTGKVTFTSPDFNPMASSSQASLLQWVLQVNMLGGDVGLANQVNNPLDLKIEIEQPSGTRDKANPLTFFLPYGVTMLFYMVILMSASLLLSGVTREKENRVMEILMSAITPRQLLGGKIAGLGLAGLVQAAAWTGTGYFLLRSSGREFRLPSEFQLPASILVWGLLFFLLGYGVYASLMAAVGALVPNLREASQATFLVILPMLIPLITISSLIEEPNSPLAVGLSLFPLTSPVAMMTRLAATQVPIWQTLLALVLLAASAALIVRAVAGMFRAQILLSGQPFQLKRLLHALTGKV